MTNPMSRRTVATRVLVSFGVTLLAFAVTASWSVAAQRRTAADSEELAKGYLPVALKIGQLRATQATLATLIDGLPHDRDPVSARLLLGTLASARHAKFLEANAAIAELGQVGTPEGRPDFAGDLAAIQGDVETDKPALDRLLAATFDADEDTFNREIVQVGAVEHSADKRLHALADRVSVSMDTLSNAAKVREARSVWALVGLTVLTLGVGVFVSLLVRRLLAPLGHVTERARAVAQGDLTPRDVRPGDDEIAELAATFEDMVGAVARARTEALSNERLAAIGKMAAHVTHEIRNPLSSIGLNVELLEEELAALTVDGSAAGGTARTLNVDSGARGLLTAISREVGRLEQLSEEYLRVARLPSPRMEAEDVAALVRDVISFTNKEMERAQCVVNVTVDGGATGKVPPALFDEAQLRQALLNLLRNARESMPKGGMIDAGVRAEGMSVVVTVDDRGSGISEDVRARIFDPFFSTKGEGTGLGLAITRQIVEAHGGTISCAAREGGGTSFRIALPIAPARAK
jgi:two-component system NtrC family sensor kinase